MHRLAIMILLATLSLGACASAEEGYFTPQPKAAREHAASANPLPRTCSITITWEINQPAIVEVVANTQVSAIGATPLASYCEQQKAAALAAALNATLNPKRGAPLE